MNSQPSTVNQQAKNHRQYHNDSDSESESDSDIMANLSSVIRRPLENENVNVQT
jgi:hypothetical protein